MPELICPHCGKPVPEEAIIKYQQSRGGRARTQAQTEARRKALEKANARTSEQRREAARKAWEKRRKNQS